MTDLVWPKARKDKKDDAGFKLDHHIGLSLVYCYLQICLNYIDTHICNYMLMCVYVYILYMYVYGWEQGHWGRKCEARGVVSSRNLTDTQSIKLSSDPGTREGLGGAKGSPGNDSRLPTFHVFSSDANTVWVVSLQAIDILAPITTPSRMYPISISPIPTPEEDFGGKQGASLCLKEEVPSPGISLQSSRQSGILQNTCFLRRNLMSKYFRFVWYIKLTVFAKSL